ncbi:MAG: HD domain-containing protein [Muribaculaceae bacterium]|nr:HD domain-containing protein [Muribaculaceae bacterium]
MNFISPSPGMAGRPEVVREMRALTAAYLASAHRKRVERLERAFRFAADAGRDRLRINGEPHILHPIAVARIMAEELSLGSTAICAALLHDVLENPDFTPAQLREYFGESLASIVEGLDRISGGIMGAEREVDAGKFRSLLMSMETDVRVVLVKMGDRMHNMRNITDLPPHKAARIARETLYVYAPLAHRIGLNAFKEEFEDLAFKYLYPDEYADIVSRVESSREERDRLVEEFLVPVRERLDAAGMNYTVKTRVKSAWSIFNKMRAKQIPFSEIYDVYACRIIFTPPEGMRDDEGCFAIRDILRSLYVTNPERDRDWVTEPKSNGYTALHLTALSHTGRWVEVQIRSRVQDEIAELGYAAHWKYKEGGAPPGAEALERGMAAIKEILDNPTPAGMDSLDHLRLSLLSTEIYVFDRAGDVMRLPCGSTVSDLAAALGPEMASKCFGAKVNRRLAHPSDPLHSGDRVELLTLSGVSAHTLLGATSLKESKIAHS